MDLFDAFDLKPGAVVSAVGGGGKTSLVYALADEAAAMGLPAIVTTTTRFTRRAGGPMPRIVEMSDESAVQVLREELRAGEALVASRGTAPQSRLVGFEPAVIDAWRELGAGVVAVEADGSAHKPFKAPAAHEPVIPSSTTDVIVCVGLDVLGKPLDELYVHRPEIVARLAKAELGEPVTVETILRVLVHDEGGRKGLPEGARLHALLNNPGDEDRRQAGSKLAGRLIFGGFYRAIVGTVHRAEIDMIAC